MIKFVEEQALKFIEWIQIEKEKGKRKQKAQKKTKTDGRIYELTEHYLNWR